MTRIVGLDGLRGVAILAVVVFHVWSPFQVGAYGVTVFFVLSGFLITRVFAAEMRLGRFYARRAVRLLPALLIVAATGWLMFGVLRWSALTYTANWVIIGGVSLGELSHTWSLAVEEQFYLVWPLLVAVALRRGRLRVVAGSLFFLSVGWYVWMMLSAGSVYRVWAGSDTSAVALLAGCCIAVFGDWLTRERLVAAAYVGVVVVSGVGLLAVWVSERSVWFLVGNLFVVLAAGVIVGGLAQGRRSRVLENPILVWFGSVSYGLYLWHYLILWTGVAPWVGVGLSVVVSWLSWTFVERPLLVATRKSPTPSRGGAEGRDGRRYQGMPSGSMSKLSFR